MGFRVSLAILSYFYIIIFFLLLVYLFNKINKEQLNKILGIIDNGKKQGASLVIGNKGYFVQPTMFTDVKDDMKIAKEEVTIEFKMLWNFVLSLFNYNLQICHYYFGSVQQILKFNDFNEVIIQGNHTNYGLTAVIFSNNIDTVNKAIQSFRADIMW